MRKLVILFALLSLQGCATMAPLSYDEQCALKGMKLAGVGSSSGTAHSFTSVQLKNQTAYANSVTRIDSEDLLCRVPSDEQEKCEVSTTAEIASPKAQYNENIGTKRTLTGLGYYLGIIPGVIAKVLYDGQRDDAIKQSLEKAKTTGCRTTASQ